MEVCNGLIDCGIYLTSALSGVIFIPLVLIFLTTYAYASYKQGRLYNPLKSAGHAILLAVLAILLLADVLNAYHMNEKTEEHLTSLEENTQLQVDEVLSYEGPAYFSGETVGEYSVSWVSANLDNDSAHIRIDYNNDTFDVVEITSTPLSYATDDCRIAGEASVRTVPCSQSAENIRRAVINDQETAKGFQYHEIANIEFDDVLVLVSVVITDGDQKPDVSIMDDFIENIQATNVEELAELRHQTMENN